MGKLTLQIVFLFLSSVVVFAQKIDHTTSFKNVQDERYFRMYYDNDYFAATDENYLQGCNLELLLLNLIELQLPETGSKTKWVA